MKPVAKEGGGLSTLLILTHAPVAVFTVGCLLASVGVIAVFDQQIAELVAGVAQDANEVEALQLFAVRAKAAWGVFLSLLLLSVLIGTLVTIWSHRRLVAGFERQLEERDATLRGDHERQLFRTRLAQAMSMADRESEALAVAERALALAAPEMPAELLLADSSQAHLRREIVGASGPAACEVQSPEACHAVRRGSALVFEDSRNLDACTHLGHRGPCSAACIPVSVMGRSVGVLHVVSEAEVPPGLETVRQLTFLADQFCTRVGMVRALATSQLQADTDALTGLLNRRSLEARVRPALATGTSAAVAMCDLDHFKHLNDTHGHATGDRALRVFSGVLRAELPDGAVIGRHGGEEFVVVLPGVHLDEAFGHLEDVREALAEAIGRSGLPVFTCSFGLTHTSRQGHRLETLIEGADALLYRAKEAGRDRIEIERRLAALG